MIYAGIGSRETPVNVCDLMFKIARHLAMHNWTLRSGHAKGADRVFENGCDDATFGRKKEIFTAKSVIPEKAFEIAAEYHPAWHACNEPARRLHARNSMILLGADLVTPCNVVLAYAPGGNKFGGTSQGIRIAEGHKIAVLNMFETETFNHLKDMYDR